MKYLLLVMLLFVPQQSYLLPIVEHEVIASRLLPQEPPVKKVKRIKKHKIASKTNGGRQIPWAYILAGLTIVFTIGFFISWSLIPLYFMSTLALAEIFALLALLLLGIFPQLWWNKAMKSQKDRKMMTILSIVLAFMSISAFLKLLFDSLRLPSTFWFFGGFSFIDGAFFAIVGAICILSIIMTLFLIFRKEQPLNTKPKTKKILGYVFQSLALLSILPIGTLIFSFSLMPFTVIISPLLAIIGVLVVTILFAITMWFKTSNINFLHADEKKRIKQKRLGTFLLVLAVPLFFMAALGAIPMIGFFSLLGFSSIWAAIVIIAFFIALIVGLLLLLDAKKD